MKKKPLKGSSPLSRKELSIRALQEKKKSRPQRVEIVREDYCKQYNDCIGDCVYKLIRLMFMPDNLKKRFLYVIKNADSLEPSGKVNRKEIHKFAMFLIRAIPTDQPPVSAAVVGRITNTPSTLHAAAKEFFKACEETGPELLLGGENGVKKYVNVLDFMERSLEVSKVSKTEKAPALQKKKKSLPTSEEVFDTV